MIKSMTGYGRWEVEAPLQKWIVELKSLNHRFLDLSLGLPRHLWALEERCRKLVKERLARGRVEMQLSYESKPGAAALHLRLDQAAAAEARAVLEGLKAAADLTEPLKLEHFLKFADFLVSREREALDLEETWEILSQALTQALMVLEEMRVREGAALGAEMAGHLDQLSQEVGRIKEQAPALPQLWQEKLKSRLEELLSEAGVDETRLAQEAAFLAERRDIAEELARLESHAAQFREALAAPGPAGRKLEFLLQEMLREINTIGSKAGDLAITQAVLTAKGILERLREQVQNVE